MKISKIEVSVVNVPFVAPIRWSGGANADWTRLVIQMHTDDGLLGLGETLGGEVTKALIETEIAAMFLGEDPFDLERILTKATFVPLYYGKCGHCAIAGLELACWDLMGKAIGQAAVPAPGRPAARGDSLRRISLSPPARRQRRGRDRHDRPHRGPCARDDRAATASARSNTRAASRRRRRRSRPCGRCAPPFPTVKLRYDPQAIYSPATSIRIGKKIEALDLEYYEDPCWGHDGMARVRAARRHPHGHQYVRHRSRRRGGRRAAGLRRCDPGRHLRMGRDHAR